MRFRYKCCPTKEDNDFSYLWLPSEYCSEIKINIDSHERPSEETIRAMMKVTEEAAKNEYSNFLVSVVRCDILQTGTEYELIFILCKIPSEILRTLKYTDVRRLTVVFLKAKNISYKFTGQMPDDSALYCEESIIDVNFS